MIRDDQPISVAAPPSNQLAQRTSFLDKCACSCSRCSTVAKAIGDCCIIGTYWSGTIPFCLCSAATVIVPGTITILQEVTKKIANVVSGTLFAIPGACIGCCYEVVVYRYCGFDGCKEGVSRGFYAGWVTSDCVSKLICHGVLCPVKCPLNCVGLTVANIAYCGLEVINKNNRCGKNNYISCIWCHAQSALELYFARKVVQEICGFPCCYEEYDIDSNVDFEGEIDNRIVPMVFKTKMEPIECMVRCDDDSI